MHKVIVERPRRGSGIRSLRKPPWEKNTDLEDRPLKEGMKKRHLYAKGQALKELNENLRPLERYLKKQVGRPWNKVYSDISKNLRTTSAVQQHVRDHVWDYVERHVDIVNGVAYGDPKFGIRLRLRSGDMYIHPRTGLLAVVKAKRK